jgi:hypothetical protein
LGKRTSPDQHLLSAAHATTKPRDGRAAGPHPRDLVRDGAKVLQWSWLLLLCVKLLLLQVLCSWHTRTTAPAVAAVAAVAAPLLSSSILVRNDKLYVLFASKNSNTIRRCCSVLAVVPAWGKPRANGVTQGSAGCRRVTPFRKEEEKAEIAFMI